MTSLLQVSIRKPAKEPETSIYEIASDATMQEAEERVWEDLSKQVYSKDHLQFAIREKKRQTFSKETVPYKATDLVESVLKTTSSLRFCAEIKQCAQCPHLIKTRLKFGQWEREVGLNASATVHKIRATVRQLFDFPPQAEINLYFKKKELTHDEDTLLSIGVKDQDEINIMDPSNPESTAATGKPSLLVSVLEAGKDPKTFFYERLPEATSMRTAEELVWDDLRKTVYSRDHVRFKVKNNKSTIPYTIRYNETDLATNFINPDYVHLYAEIGNCWACPHLTKVSLKFGKCTKEETLEPSTTVQKIRGVVKKLFEFPWQAKINLYFKKKELTNEEDTLLSIGVKDQDTINVGVEIRQHMSADEVKCLENEFARLKEERTNTPGDDKVDRH